MIMQRIHNDLAKIGLPTPLTIVDGKPLLVSPVSGDPDARCGHITGGLGRGYKLHAMVTEDKRIVVWSVTALNVHETHVAEEMCSHLPRQLPDALILGDGNYDAADLHKRVARTGARLVVPLRGMATHPVTLRQMGAARREHVEATSEHPDLVKYILKGRSAIERTFSMLTCYGGGLGPLPSWVRRLERVKRWVGCKIALFHARLQCRNPMVS